MMVAKFLCSNGNWGDFMNDLFFGVCCDGHDEEFIRVRTEARKLLSSGTMTEAKERALDAKLDDVRLAIMNHKIQLQRAS